MIQPLNPQVLLSGNKLKSKIWVISIIFVMSVMTTNSQANETTHKTKRVPAEWERQEAIWICLLYTSPSPRD